MVETRRVVVVVGALAGAIVAAGCAVLFARFATAILMGTILSARSPMLVLSMTVMVPILVILGSSLRRRMARKRRLVAVR